MLGVEAIAHVAFKIPFLCWCSSVLLSFPRLLRILVIKLAKGELRPSSLQKFKGLLV